jgi:hypothetical protein
VGIAAVNARWVSAMGKDDDGQSSQATEQAIQQFFQESHTEGGKTVAAHELITMRPETVGVGAFSRVRLVEVKSMAAYVREHAGVTAEDLEKEGRPEAAAGIFVLKVIKKTEVVRLKQAEHVKSEALILSQVSHPFIVNLYHRFQDDRHLYLLEEFVQVRPSAATLSAGPRLCSCEPRFCGAPCAFT